MQPVSRFFRTRRNRALCLLIETVHARKGAPVELLDIGGSLIFWLSIPDTVRARCRIRLLNLPSAYAEHRSADEERLAGSVTLVTGDARDLSRFADGVFDLVICNSVIEHVGSWADMTAAASEARRVGCHGWVQVPAFEFPVEQHFLLPFVHWFADPIQVALLSRLHGPFRRRSIHDRHMSVHHVRPLTRRQLRHLLPDATLRSEWVLLPKSHVATW